MMLSNDDIEDLFRHHRENDHHQRPNDRAPEHAERERRITLQVSKNTPDGFHPWRAMRRIVRACCLTTVKAAHSANLHPIAPATAGFMSIFEGQLCDSGFIQLSQAFRDHALVLFLGRPREGKLKTELTRELERDATVFGRMRGGEKGSVLAVLHIFAVGFKNA